MSHLVVARIQVNIVSATMIVLGESEINFKKKIPIAKPPIWIRKREHLLRAPPNSDGFLGILTQRWIYSGDPTVSNTLQGQP